MNIFLAEATAAGAAMDPTGSLISTVVMFAVLILVFYFFMIRPENKKKKAMDEMRAALKVGDKITTIGGIVGTVVHIKDENVVIETSADRVRLEITKWAISVNNTADAQKAASKTERKAKK